MEAFSTLRDTLHGAVLIGDRAANKTRGPYLAPKIKSQVSVPLATKEDRGSLSRLLSEMSGRMVNPVLTMDEP